jgi:Na+-transporting methylmalonyl-CoA/oxaloacetate decarboxylase gamma subunit
MGLKELIPQVMASWQVWATILVLVLFMYIVGYVSRTHHRPRRKPKPKKKKEEAAPAADQDETQVPV